MFQKQSKCDFNVEEISILEVVVEQGEVQMENDKVIAVMEWKPPIKVKSFLKFANFYQKFIKNFSHTAKPLNELKGKKKWKWEKEHQETFKELKKKITSQPILTLLKREEKF